MRNKINCLRLSLNFKRNLRDYLSLEELNALFLCFHCQSECNMGVMPRYVSRLLMTMGIPLGVAGRQGQSASLFVMHYRRRRLIV